MIPSPGRIVQYTLSDQDAEQVNRRRTDFSTSLSGAGDHTGFVGHTGNAVKAGENYPLLITRVWSSSPDEATAVNGQVMLDGNDTLWVTSVQQGDGERRFREFPRV